MIFFRFCLGIFESDTVKSDCPVQIFREMMKYIKIKVYLTSFTRFFSGDINTKLYKKKIYFYFFYLFFLSPDPTSEKKIP